MNLIAAAKKLRTEVNRLRFSTPVAYVYNPLDYAWASHELYLKKFGQRQKKIVFLGMNPGPFGMAQTGVPFGEISAVRDWMKINAPINKPIPEHPRRPVLGFACPRTEVSGKRLWGFFAEKYGAPEKFFAQHFVANYCPLVFMAESGANLTPDKLPAAEMLPLNQACDLHLRELLESFQPEWIIGVGAFAAKRAEIVSAGLNIKVGQILHPSPASPAANRDWAGQVQKQLKTLGVWPA